MNNSILNSVKKQIGIEAEYTHFDPDLIMHINTVLIYLYQMGVGVIPYSIQDANNTWDEFLGTSTDLEMIKSYVALKVKMIFDPPTSSALKDAILNNISEMEWRISVSVNPSSSVI